MVSEAMLDDLDRFAKERGLTERQKEKLVRKLEEWCDRSKVEPWEDVGLIAAQSMGEPATQATLRTFHFAGSAEVSVTSGMTRMQEIADTLRNISTPVMKVYLKPPYSEDYEKAKEVAASLEEAYLSDVAKIEEDFFAKEIRVEIDEEKCLSKGIDVDRVVKKIEQKVGKGVRSGNTIVYNFKKEPLIKIRKISLQLEKLHLKGLKNVRYAVVKKEGDEYMIMTSGTNLKAVLKKKEVDHRRTYSNDIREVVDVLGIEAARQLIIMEFEEAYGDLTVDKRHFSVVADAMTREGVLMPIGRTGIAGRKGSVLARAAFEETGKHITEAAVRGEEDRLQGVVENLIVGLPVNVGTGKVKLGMRIGGK